MPLLAAEEAIIEAKAEEIATKCGDGVAERTAALAAERGKIVKCFRDDSQSIKKRSE